MALPDVRVQARNGGLFTDCVPPLIAGAGVLVAIASALVTILAWLGATASVLAIAAGGCAAMTAVALGGMLAVVRLQRRGSRRRTEERGGGKGCGRAC